MAKEEAEEAAKYGLQPGDFKYKDQNEDGIMTNEDRIFQGYTTPRFRWAFRNEFIFHKNISFHVRSILIGAIMVLLTVRQIIPIFRIDVPNMYNLIGLPKTELMIMQESDQKI